MKDDDGDGKKPLAEVISNNIKLIIVIISLITALIMLFVAYVELRDTSVQTVTWKLESVGSGWYKLGDAPLHPVPSLPITPTPTPTSAEGIDQFQIDWGTMATYFDISDVTIGKTQTTDILGMVSEYDSINFIVEATRSFDAIILFEATFYDDNGIEVYSSGVYFNPDYNRWDPGVRAEGYMILPSTGMEEIRFIEVSQFAY